MIFKISVRAEATAAVLYEYYRYRQDRRVRYVSPALKNTPDKNTAELVRRHRFKIDAATQIPRAMHPIPPRRPATLKNRSALELLNDASVGLGGRMYQTALPMGMVVSKTYQSVQAAPRGT
jgi:hypothetical protein